MPNSVSLCTEPTRREFKEPDLANDFPAEIQVETEGNYFRQASRREEWSTTCKSVSELNQ
jgi:hypothetical protein